MTTTVSEPTSNFPLAPEGLWQAVCCDVLDLYQGEKPAIYGGGTVTKTRLVWLLEAADPETGQPYEVSKEYTANLHEKSTLRHHLEAWRGRRFTDEELKAFDLEKLIGANCQIQICHRISETKRKPYAAIQTIVALGKNTTKLQIPSGYSRRRDIQKNNGHHPMEERRSVEEEEVPF